MTRAYCSAALALSLLLGVGESMVMPAQAQTRTSRNPAPAPLQTLIQNLDTAANQRNLTGVLDFYSPEFAATDGLNRSILEQVIQRLWQDYPTLTYQTTINRWQAISNGWEVELTTKVTGTGTFQDQPLQLDSQLTSRQRIVNGKIIWQDITAEQTKVVSGSAPPTIQFNVPQAVKVGQDYNLDVIVQEPLGDALLLGSAVVQGINAETYLNPPNLKLELLSAGGLFKIGQAPNQPGSQWISVALIRDTGKVLVTQRLRVGQL